MPIDSNSKLISIGVEFVSYDGEVTKDDSQVILDAMLKSIDKHNIKYTFLNYYCEPSYAEVDDDEITYFMLVSLYLDNPDEDVDSILDIMYDVVDDFGYSPFDWDVIEDDNAEKWNNMGRVIL